MATHQIFPSSSARLLAVKYPERSLIRRELHFSDSLPAYLLVLISADKRYFTDLFDRTVEVRCKVLLIFAHKRLDRTWFTSFLKNR